VSLSQCANDALAQEKERIDVLLARQYNLISCVLQQDEPTSKPKSSLEHRTLGKYQLLSVISIPVPHPQIRRCDSLQLHSCSSTAANTSSMASVLLIIAYVVRRMRDMLRRH
jgi:hypothetical protein